MDNALPALRAELEAQVVAAGRAAIAACAIAAATVVRKRVFIVPASS